MCHFSNIISDSFLLFSTFAIIRNKWRHSFQAKCAYWHQNECLPSIMHQFDAECDPACEYLTAVHAFLICILLTHSLSLSLILSASASFPLSCFFSLSIIKFQEFPPGSRSSITAKAGGCSLFSYFPFPPTTWPSKLLSSQKTNKQTKHPKEKVLPK